MTGWLCCERALLRGECLSGYNTGMIVLKEKTLLLNGQMPGWSVAWLCLLLGRVPAMPGPSCWGCVPTPAAPLSPFRAEEPEGPKCSHLPAGIPGISPPNRFGFPPVTGVSCPSLWGSEPAGPCCSLLGAVVWQTTQPWDFWSIPAPEHVPSVTQPCVWCPVLRSWECPLGASVTSGRAVPPLTW